jgi:hypothetical protein
MNNLTPEPGLPVIRERESNVVLKSLVASLPYKGKKSAGKGK